MKPLLLICGPTACHKSETALRLAERWGGEILSIDSVAVYRGMDIGSAKPDVAERRRIPHHLIDMVDPDDDFSVAAVDELHGAVELLVELWNEVEHGLRLAANRLYGGISCVHFCQIVNYFSKLLNSCNS